jgi:DNA polymerase (family 10)
MSDNVRIAAILYEISEILTIKGDRFRSRAYNMAAQRIAGLPEDIRGIMERKQLEDIPGIGKSIAMTIEEFLEKGESKILQELQESLPKGVAEMIELEGIGPKIAMRLNQELDIVSIETLEKAVKHQKIRELRGFGPKKEENILRAIEEYRSRSTRFLLGEIIPIIQGLLSYMRNCEAIRKIEVAGSARRGKETIGDLDILVSSEVPDIVSDHFINMPPVARILSHGLTKSQVILNNQLQVDLRVIPPESYGAALQYFTGSMEHNVKLRTISVKSGYKLNEYGLFNRVNDELIVAEDESEIYHTLGMDWIPPEIRENTGEIEAAIERSLPKLIELTDIHGDLHIHSDWSDGQTNIRHMTKKSIEMGYEYIAITDHTKSLGIANGLDERRLKDQIKEINIINEEYPEIHILSGTECDILKNGNLDINNEVLRELDFVIASIHSGFKQDEDTLTKRIITAIHNEYVNAIGHPTGRLIQKRRPYELDLDRVFEAASQQKVLMEINCYPNRLDLRDVNCRNAKEYGVTLFLGSDAHTANQLEFLPLGISTARRGWLSKKDIINSFKFDEIIKFRNQN